MYTTGRSVVKAIVIWVVFALLHYATDLIPNPVIAFFGEADGAETVWGHLKMNFWTYIFVTIGEFFIFRKKISDVGQFWYTRLLSAVLYPWLSMTFWMRTGSALNGGLEPIRPIELSFSLLSNAFGAYLAVRLEQVFDGVKVPQSHPMDDHILSHPRANSIYIIRVECALVGIIRKPLASRS